MKRIWTKSVRDERDNYTPDCEWYWVNDNEPVSEVKGGSSPPANQTVRNEPPSFLVPQLTEGVTQARGLLDSGQLSQEFFPGSTVVGFSPQTEQALNLAEQRAVSGSPLLQGAQNQFLNTITGDAANTNPFLDAQIDAATRGVVRNFNEVTNPGIEGNFSGKGRFGSGLQQNEQDRALETLLRTTGDISTNISSSNFQNERARQLQASLGAPGLANQDFADIERLAAVGGAREGLETAQLQEEIDRFNQGQQEPANELARFLSLIQSGVVPGTGTTSSTFANQGRGGGANLLGGLAGGALGLGAASSIPGIGLIGASGGIPALGFGALGALGPVGLGIGAAGALAGAFG